MSEPIEISSLSAIDHVLKHAPKRLRAISSNVPYEKLSRRAQEIFHLAKEKGIRTSLTPAKTKERASDLLSATLDPFSYQELKSLFERERGKPRSLVVVLDHLQDSQNFGAIARVAEGLGAAAIVIPKDRSVSVNAGVYHSSVGAVETVPIVLVQNTAEALRKLKEEEFWIVGTSLGDGSKSLNETPSFERVALVLGSELEGMSNLVEKTCDWLIQIPLVGKVQSLNVSSAAAILIHHFLSTKK